MLLLILILWINTVVEKVCISSGNDDHFITKAIFIYICLDTIQHFWIARSNSFRDLYFEVFSVWTFDINSCIIFFVTNKHEILVSTFNTGNYFVTEPVNLLLSPLLQSIRPKQLICLNSGRNNSTIEIIWNLSIVIFWWVDVDHLSVLINWTTNVPNINRVLVSTFHCQVASIGSIWIRNELHIYDFWVYILVDLDSLVNCGSFLYDIHDYDLVVDVAWNVSCIDVKVHFRILQVVSICIKKGLVNALEELVVLNSFKQSRNVLVIYFIDVKNVILSAVDC